MENLIKDIYVSLNGTCARLVRNYLLSKKKDWLKEEEISFVVHEVKKDVNTLC